ncbi:MAG: (2Fe-2S)-binding protein [Saccharospirillaceae bacterium]|nr:(2Fe-2S)-binding protein [Pseudomonadales bacterium]NRB78762.1 (2Fe-2S)-binding protein [Saccharospirillaceae bacterium]
MQLKINGQSMDVSVDQDTPLLWVLRDHLKLTGTKFGCGKGLCGACTVLVNDKPLRSCSVPVSVLKGMNITTIEGLSGSTAIQQAFVKHDVPQCGFCQSGQIMAATALLATNANPSENDIKNTMTNLCRCGTYPRIKAAIQDVAKKELIL